MFFKKRKLVYFCLLVAIYIFSGCTPAYIPNIVNSPNFSNKGEFQSTVALGTHHSDLQFGYAATDHIGILLNGSFGSSDADTSLNFHQHGFGEFGLGYYTTLSKITRFELFGGLGGGTIKARFENDFYRDNVNASFTRVFFQPGIGIATDVFDGSFTTRMVLVKMNLYQDNLNNTFNTSLAPYIEPVITAKIGYKYIKLFSQLGFSIPLKQNLDYNHQLLIASFGLHFKFGKKERTAPRFE